MLHFRQFLSTEIFGQKSVFVLETAAEGARRSEAGASTPGAMSSAVTIFVALSPSFAAIMSARFAFR